MGVIHSQNLIGLHSVPCVCECVSGGGGVSLKMTRGVDLLLFLN